MAEAVFNDTRQTARSIRASFTRQRILAVCFTFWGVLQMAMAAAWDVQWHTSVGRNDFWIPPHVMLYSGTLIILLTVGYILARETWLYRAGARDTATFSFLGLHAPLGIFLTVLGTVMMFIAAPFDELWHMLYGLDVTVWSPPHLLLIAGTVTITFGALYTLLIELNRNPQISRVFRLTGIFLAGGMLLDFANFSLQPAMRLAFQIRTDANPYLYTSMIAWMAPFLLALATSAARQPGMAFAIVLANYLSRMFYAGFTALAFGFAISNLGVVPIRDTAMAPTWHQIGIMFIPALAIDAAYLLSRLHKTGSWKLYSVLGGAVWGVALCLTIFFLTVQGSSLGIAAALGAMPFAILGGSLSSLAGSALGRRLATAKR